MKIKTYNDFLFERKISDYVEIAKRNNMTEECMHLVVWWGLTGYLYYHSMKEKNPPITEEGKKMLKILFDSIVDGTYSDSLNNHKSIRDQYDPVMCEEKVDKQMGRNYIDDTFNANLIELKHPIKVYKDYSKDKFITGKDTAWYSFSVIKGRDKNAYGDAYICYELPAGFKYLDARGLAEKGEILINGKYLTDDMIIKDANEMKIDLKKGDKILTGKWQNKPDEVKSVGKNDIGQPTVNGKPMLKFRIKRLMPKKKTNESILSFENFLNDNSSNTIRLYRGLENKFDSKYDASKTDAPNGYSTWTDSLELAKQYAGDNGFIYYLDLPKSELGKSAIDEDPHSETYGDRALFFFNEKPASLNGVKGKEVLVYMSHDLYDPNMIKEL